MATNLVGRWVFIGRVLRDAQEQYLDRVGRVAAVAPDGRFFRVLVDVPGMGLATFDASDLAALPWWRARVLRWRGK